MMKMSTANAQTQTFDVRLPEIGSQVKVNSAGSILIGVVTRHDSKDGKPNFHYAYDFKSVEGDVVRSDRWAWPGSIYSPELEQAIESLSYVDAQDLLDNFCGAGIDDEHEVEVMRVQVRKAYFKGDIPGPEIMQHANPAREETVPSRFDKTKPFRVGNLEFTDINDAIEAASAASTRAENRLSAQIYQTLQKGVYGYAGYAVAIATFENGRDLDEMAADEDGVPDDDRRAQAFRPRG